MPTAILATPKHASANSYVTQAEAVTYFGDRLFSTVFTGAVSDDQIKALLWATKILDTRVDWKGVKTTGGQALDWPRAYVPDPDLTIPPPGTSLDLNEFYLDADTVPNFLKWAQCEQALALIGADTTLDPGTMGFSAISVGSISLTIDKLDKAKVLPRPVRDLIAQYGSVISGSGNAKLLRA